MGRQAQMIPVFASIVVQIVELSVPKVWSLFWPPVLRVVKRRIDVTQTLSACQWNCISFVMFKNLQEPKEKDKSNPYFLVEWHLQSSNLSHWQEENDDVPNDVRGCIRVPKGSEIDAGAFNLLIPDTRDGHAFENGRNDACRSVQQDVGHYTIHETSKALVVAEDA